MKGSDKINIENFCNLTQMDKYNAIAAKKLHSDKVISVNEWHNLLKKDYTYTMPTLDSETPKVTKVKEKETVQDVSDTEDNSDDQANKKTKRK